jgi:hypothetical protein
VSDVIRILSPGKLPHPAKISTRVAAWLFALIAPYGIAHVSGMIPMGVAASHTRTSACQSEQLHVGFRLDGRAWVTDAVITGVTAPCFDKAYRLTVQGSAGAPVYTATGTTRRTGFAVVPIANLPASDITGITIVVSS